MSSQIETWSDLKDADSLQVEEVLRSVFPQSDAYRYNSASIRVRVIDERFRGLSHPKRDDLIEPLLDQLPENLQAEIMNLLLLHPHEVEESFSAKMSNLEFENPQASDL